MDSRGRMFTLHFGSLNFKFKCFKIFLIPTQGLKRLGKEAQEDFSSIQKASSCVRATENFLSKNKANS